MKVQKLMSKTPKCCRATDSLQQAAQLMWTCDIGSLPVVDQQERIIGMITDRDISMSAFHNDRPLSAIKVGEAMASNVVSCRPDDEVAVADLLMRNNQIRRLPITDRNGQLLGMVSLNDLARKAAQDRLLSSPQVSGSTVVVTLAAISEPRTTIGDTLRA